MSTAALPSPFPEFAHRRSPALLAGIVAAHLLAIWGLLQLDGLRRALVEQVPLMVSLVSAPATPLPPKPVALVAPPKTLTPPPRALVVPEITVTQPATVPPAPRSVAPPEPVRMAASAPPAPAMLAPVDEIPAAPIHLESNQIAFLREPQLVYPPLSVSRREAGTVVLRVLVDAQGQMQDVRIERSSGFERLDAAALAAMRTARFKPYVVRGRPTAFVALKPMVFNLG